MSLSSLYMLICKELKHTKVCKYIHHLTIMVYSSESVLKFQGCIKLHAIQMLHY